MKIYTFKEGDKILKKSWGEQYIPETLEKIAKTSNTNDLVVAIYFLTNSYIWWGVNYKRWFIPSDFHAYTKRKWAFVRSFGKPEDLPERFRLIRMVFGTSIRYPRTVTDAYGWQYKCQTFHAHLASLFAHELHHYRRRHLGLHPNEGEQSACKWSQKRSMECGFPIEACRLPKRKANKTKNKKVSLPSGRNPKLLRRAKQIAAHLSYADLKNLEKWAIQRQRTYLQQRAKMTQKMHVEELRSLPEGAPLLVRVDHPKSPYINTTVVKVRNLRRDSPRMKIRTSDGKLWNWPMAWLDVPGRSPKIVF